MIVVVRAQAGRAPPSGELAFPATVAHNARRWGAYAPFV